MSIGLLKASAKVSAILAEESDENVRVIVRSLCAALGFRIMTEEEIAFMNRSRTVRERDSERMRAARERKREQNVNEFANGGRTPPSPSLHSPSPSGSSLSHSEQIRRDQDPASTAQAPASARGESGAVSWELSRLVETYATTARAAARRTWAFPSRAEQRDALVEAVRAHALANGKPCATFEDREAWLAFTLPHYVTYVLAEEAKGGDARKFATLAPTGFLAWLNRNPEALPEEQPSGVVAAAHAVRALAAGIGRPV